MKRKTNIKQMNKVLVIFCCLVAMCANAQIVIKRSTSKSWEDIWSTKHYNSINIQTTERLAHTTANMIFVDQLNDVISHQRDELKSFSTGLSLQKTGLVNFVKGSSFNSTAGYNSYGYIQEKYPIINLVNPSDLFRNTIIRSRFFTKLNKEANYISDYLDTANPIPEGERILMVLSALENIINLTLENEKY